MSATISIKIFEILEDRLGREQAKEVVREIELAADSMASEKKREITDELRKEIVTRDIFDTRIALLETKIESKLKLYFLVLLFVVLFTNPKALDLIARIFGIVK